VLKGEVTDRMAIICDRRPPSSALVLLSSSLCLCKRQEDRQEDGEMISVVELGQHELHYTCVYNRASRVEVRAGLEVSGSWSCAKPYAVANQ
jgi:hypothetical protein